MEMVMCIMLPKRFMEMDNVSCSDNSFVHIFYFFFFSTFLFM